MRNIAAVLVSVLSIAFLAAPSYAYPVNFTAIPHYNLPSEVGKLIGDARVNIYDYSNNALGSIVLLNGTVNQTSDRLLTNPSYEIYVRDAATLQNIFTADSALKEFNRERSLHNIDIRALDFWGQMKLTFGTMLLSVSSLFISPQ